MRFVRWLVFHKLQKVVVLGCLVLMWLGGWGVWNALRHGQPTAVRLADSPLTGVPDHVTLQNVRIAADEAVALGEGGKRRLYIPLRPQGSAANATPHVLLRIDASAPSTLGAQTAVTGMIASAFETSPQVARELQAKMPGLREFKVIVAGDAPSLGRSVTLLLAGFAIFVLFALVTSDDKPPAAEPPLLPQPTASVAEPPLLPATSPAPSSRPRRAVAKGRPWGQPPD